MAIPVLAFPNICRVCGVCLVEGVNFSDSANEKKDRICRGCNSNKMRKWRYDNAEKYEEIKEKEREKYREHREERLKWQREYKEREPLKHHYNKNKNGASNRRIAFSLTIEQFSNYWQKPCTYCGDSIKTIGLDRVDSTKGYEEGNIVPCCIVCNKMKTNYTKDFFFAHIKKILSRL